MKEQSIETTNTTNTTRKSATNTNTNTNSSTTNTNFTITSKYSYSYSYSYKFKKWSLLLQLVQVLQLLLLLQQIQPTNARYTCLLSGNYIADYDPEQQSFTQIFNIDKNEYMNDVNSNRNPNTNNNDNNNNNDKYDEKPQTIRINAKKCSCLNHVEYCLIQNDENRCSVQRWRSENKATFCYKTNWMDNILQLFYLPVILLFVVILIMPCTTPMGKNAILYLVSFFTSFWRNRSLDGMIQIEMEAITEHIAIEDLNIHEFDDDNNNNNNTNTNNNNNSRRPRTDGMIEQTVLKLKTKSLNINYQFKYEDKTCLICMSTIEEGERIGDLSCGHSFHVDCLKEWIQRRNVCPLCNSQVADLDTVLVDRNEVFANDGSGDEVDEETQNRFEQLISFYRHRTTRRISGAS